VSSDINSLSNITSDRIDDVEETLEHLIDHMAQRIEYAESRRSSVAALGGALLAGGLGLLPLIINLADYPPVRVALICVVIVWIIFGFLIWIIYARQTNFRYPFTEVAKTPKWFYRYALEDYKQFNAPWHTFQRKSELQQGKQAFDTQWIKFRDQQVQILSDKQQNILQDLQQVYLLHVNERYKNLFLTQLRNVLFWGVCIGLIVGLLGFIAGLFLVSTGFVSKQQVISNGSLTIEASWRDIGQSRVSSTGTTETQLLMNILVNNHGQTNIDITDNQIVIVDNFQMQIPFFIESVKPSPITIPAGSSARVSVILWVPQALRATINHVEVVP
jgi:hypothetical protein